MLPRTLLEPVDERRELGQGLEVHLDSSSFACEAPAAYPLRHAKLVLPGLAPREVLLAGVDQQVDHQARQDHRDQEVSNQGRIRHPGHI